MASRSGFEDAIQTEEAVLFRLTKAPGQRNRLRIDATKVEPVFVPEKCTEADAAVVSLCGHNLSASHARLFPSASLQRRRTKRDPGGTISRPKATPPRPDRSQKGSVSTHLDPAQRGPARFGQVWWWAVLVVLGRHSMRPSRSTGVPIHHRDPSGPSRPDRPPPDTGRLGLHVNHGSGRSGGDWLGVKIGVMPGAYRWMRDGAW